MRLSTHDIAETLGNLQRFHWADTRPAKREPPADVVISRYTRRRAALHWPLLAIALVLASSCEGNLNLSWPPSSREPAVTAPREESTAPPPKAPEAETPKYETVFTPQPSEKVPGPTTPPQPEPEPTPPQPEPEPTPPQPSPPLKEDALPPDETPSDDPQTVMVLPGTESQAQQPKGCMESYSSGKRSIQAFSSDVSSVGPYHQSLIRANTSFTDAIGGCLNRSDHHRIIMFYSGLVAFFQANYSNALVFFNNVLKLPDDPGAEDSLRIERDLEITIHDWVEVLTECASESSNIEELRVAVIQRIRGNQDQVRERYERILGSSQCRELRILAQNKLGKLL